LAAKEAGRKAKLDENGTERDGSPPEWGAEKSGRRSKSPLGRSAERNGKLGENGAEGTGSALEQKRAEFEESLQGNAERSRSPSEGAAVKKSGTDSGKAGPEGASGSGLGAQSPLTSRSGAEKVETAEEDQGRRSPLEPNGTESTAAKGRTVKSGLSSVLGANRGGLRNLGTLHVGNRSGGDGGGCGLRLACKFGQ
jgi:hypothetical protein